MSFKLRDYQQKIAVKGLAILKQYKILYLAMEVRTGKTLTALEIARQYNAEKVLFLTKKKAVETETIQKDYELLGMPFKRFVIINNESLHKVLDNDFDLIISDEHHRNGSFPKPNLSTKEIKKRFGKLPMIFLSGTPNVESGSQIYHQFWTSDNSPFKQFKNFYAWAKVYTTPTIKHFGALKVPDYSNAKNDKIDEVVGKYYIKLTQAQAGFTAEITEQVLHFNNANPSISVIINTLKKKKIYTGSLNTIYDLTILCDSPASLMTKIHQLENGTVIDVDGKTHILDTSKAQFIKNKFYNKKIAIFYFFQAELDILKQVFGETLTTDIHEFNNSEKNFAIQQVSGSEAISLKEADALVYYNFGYSGKNYIQGRDRMTTKDREENNVYVVLSGSLSERIYKTIKEKKNFNVKMFERGLKQ